MTKIAVGKLTGRGVRVARAASAVLACALALGACGGGASSPTAVSTSPPASTATSVAQLPASTQTPPVPDATATTTVAVTIPATATATAAEVPPTATAEPSPTTAPTQTPTTPQATETTVPAEPTEVQPPVGGATLPKRYKLFKSKIHPYSIGYPPGWVAKGDAFRIGNVRGDLIQKSMLPDAGTNVNLITQPLPAGTRPDSEEYLELNEGYIRRSLNASIQRLGPVKVAGQQATLVALKYPKNAQPGYETTQVYWTDQKRGWVVTLTTLPGKRQKYIPVFKTMLGTIRTER